MAQSEILVELYRGGHLESLHRGHAVICGPDGQIEEAWGDPEGAIFPRSSCKMVQALPLVESGAADAVGLTPAQLALSCASHEGAAIHTEAVSSWLEALGLDETALACGAQAPRDRDAKHAMIRAGAAPCRIHNNCSGKHAGFLTLANHLGAPLDGYEQLDHPVQQAARTAIEDCAQETTQGHGIDGCSAPNFRVSLAGLGRAMAQFASASRRSGARAAAQARLVDAMRTHPELVAGQGRACTELMRASGGALAVKTGAEGVFVAMLPESGRAIALKIEDGATRASECAVAALLVRLGALDADHPLVSARRTPTLRNFAGQAVGEMRPGGALLRAR